ncbi:MAG: hypothetical protein HY286_00275 [Planctomycetes bacterium]|nr:hypothetical protein [Planctomycetota bacterium]
MEQFYGKIQTFSTEDSLPFLARRAREIYYEACVDSDEFRWSRIPDAYRSAIDLWQIAFIAKSLITISSDYRQKKLTEHDFVTLIDHYNHLEDPSIPKASETSSADAWWHWFLRLTNSQFPFRDRVASVISEFGRALILFHDLEAMPGISIKRELVEMYGMNMQDLLSCVHFTLEGTKRGIMVGPELAGATIKGRELVKKYQQFLGQESTGYSEFRRLQKPRLLRPELDLHQFNALWKKPIIHTERRRRMICPIPLCLVQKYTRGVYFDLLDKHNAGGGDNKFASLFGKYVFEPYVGRFLGEKRSDRFVHAAIRHGKRSKSNESVDWLVRESNTAVLIECKTRAPATQTITTGNVDIVRAELISKLKKALKECASTRDAIRDGVPEFHQFVGVTRFNYLIVLFTECWIFESEGCRRWLESAIPPDFTRGAKYHIISIHDLETMSQLIDRYSISEILEEKQQIAYCDPFREFLIKFAARRGITINHDVPVLTTRFRRFLDEISEQVSNR